MRTATPLAAAALLAAAVPTAAAPQSAAAEPGPAVGGRSEIFAGGEMESYVRYLQSLGIARPYPWSVRGFSPRELDAVLPADSVAHPWRSRYDLRGGQRLGTFADYVRPAVTLRYNSAFPFGGNDGAVWAGRGLTTAVQGGVAVRFAAARAELSMTLAPIAARAENGPFALASPLNPTTLSPFADAGYGSVVDRPQRFGTGAYSVVDPGQSTVRVDAGPVAVGISTANQVWGPAERFNAVLGNNAAGFAHVYVGTARPLDLKLVRVHGRAVWGRLEQSDYSPVTGPAKFASPEQPGTRRFMAGLVGTVQPGALPGLELGVSRFYHSPWPEGGLSGAQFTKPFEAVLKADLGPQNGVPGDRLSDYDNQLASLFGRWVFPGTGFELYGEYAREDHNYNARDLVQEPDHEAGYVVGARKAYLRRDGRILALRGEVINFEMQPLARWRVQGLFYVHGFMRQGHTNRGQPLGADAGIGTGGASAFGADWYSPRGRLSATWTRTLRRARVELDSEGLAKFPNEDDARGRDVVHALAGEGRFFLGRVDVTGGVAAVLDLNRDFARDVFNLNASLGVRRDFR